MHIHVLLLSQKLVSKTAMQPSDLLMWKSLQAAPYRPIVLLCKEGITCRLLLLLFLLLLRLHILCDRILLLALSHQQALSASLRPELQSTFDQESQNLLTTGTSQSARCRQRQALQRLWELQQGTDTARHTGFASGAPFLGSFLDSGSDL